MEYVYLVALYGAGMIPTHIAIKHIGLEMSRLKRVVALTFWPWFSVVLVFCDIASDAINGVSK